MFKQILGVLAIVGLLSACSEEAKEGTFQQVEAAAPAPPSATPSEQLAAVAIEEGDLIGRVRQSFVALQEEYKKANGKVPGIGDVAVLVDENFNLLIENRHDGHVYQTKVNLKNLNNEQGGLSLIPDRAAGEFPGLKIMVKAGKPGVEKIKDGKLEKTEPQLEIYLADRPSIERVTPAILQALNVANGKMPE